MIPEKKGEKYMIEENLPDLSNHKKLEAGAGNFWKKP